MAVASLLIPAEGWYVRQRQGGGAERSLPVAAFAYIAALGDTYLAPWVWSRAAKEFVDARTLPGVIDVYRAAPAGEPFVGATVAELKTALPEVAQATDTDITGAVNTAILSRLATSIADQRISDALRQRKLPPE